MAETKTNAMRQLESAKLTYFSHSYPTGEWMDGTAVADSIQKPYHQVFKTLVTRGASREIYVFVIPVSRELDLKAAARAVGERSIEMVKVDEINKLTGYIKGGCSPIGMKKRYRTTIDESAQEMGTIIFSAGRIGSQIELPPDDLITVTGAAYAKIATD